MADKNPFDDPSFNKNPNPFDDPDFGGPSGVVRRVVGDSAVSLGKGVIGAGEAAVGLADLASGGRAGKFLSTAFGYDPKASKEMLDEYYSPEQRAANAAVQKAEGFFPTIATAIQNPSTIAQSAVESAPLMLGGGAVARGVRAALTPAAERAAAAVAGRAAASRVSPVVAGAVGEGAVTAGSQAEQIRQETKNGLLTPEQAALAAASGFATGALTLGAGRAAQKLGISDIDIALAGGGLQGQGKGLVRRAAEGALSEGILEEMPQSAQEQIAQNLALGKPWSEGVANAAAMGALTGGLIGGGVNVLSGPDAQPAPQPGSAGGVPLLPAPGSPGAPASEIGPDAGQMDLIRQHAIQNAVDAAAAQDAAREAEAQRLRAFHGPLSTASGPAPESPAPPPPPAGPALLMAPGSPGAPASEIGPDAGQMDLVRQHAIQNAVDAAAAQDAAREAEAQRLRSFHGPLSTAAATAVESGVAATSAQARAEALQDKVAPTQRLALPAPVTEQEKGAQAAINEYAGSKSSVPLDQAQAQSFNAFSRGHELVVVPHPSGKGYTTVPSSMLNPRQMAAVESIQRPDQGQIPSPNTEMPGQWVAPDGGLPAARTYDENQSTQRAAWSAWRTAAGTPVPRQPPIKDEARATQVAERRTQETGREHVVVPHPMSSTGFAVAPAPATIDGEATAVQEATAAAAAPEQASATAAAPQPAADAIGDEDAAANRAILAAAQESATSHRNDLSHPTSAQAKAGNYKKARLPRDLVGGLPVTLENEAGSVRVGTDGDWARAQSAHYGYIRAEGNPKAKGNDGDDIDIAIGPRPATGKTFIIDQDDPLTGDFDEHKVYHGYRTAEEAEAAYRANYPEGWNGFRGITEVSVDELKRWRDNDDKSIPYAENPGAEIMPDLDSRYQGNIDHAAGADALPVDRSRGSRGTRLAMRILRAPTMEAQDKGLEELPSLAKEIVAAALADVRDLGMPEVAFDGLSAIGMHNTQGGGEGVYAWSPQAISLHRRLLEDVARGDEMAARTLRGVIAHETWHHLDNGDVYFSSARSPLLEIVQSNGLFMPAGEIAIEAWEQFENPGSPLQRYLNYPLGAAQNVRAGLTALQHAEILQNEVFAQLGRLFYTNPKLMRERLPKAHRLFQEIHRGIESASNIGEARAAVRAALLSQAAVSRGADRGSDRNAREGSGDGRADHGRDGVQHVLESRSVATEGDGANGRGQRDARVPASRPDGEPQGQAPLVGLPSYSPGPFSAAREAAATYMREAGLPYDPPTDFVKVDPENAKRVADAYAAMPHDPKNIQVRRAYRAMIKETLAQWRAIEKTGLKVTFGTKENPYPYTIPQDVFTDVRENNHMWVYPTSDGFGSDASFDASDNPLLEDTGIVIGGHKLLANDVFRIVHDYFGHIKEGVGFRANGEENAWRIHSAMYSPEARKAMTSETRGQNSWLNWGPHGEKNRTAKTEDTVFADQKTGLMPDWVVNGEKPPELEARETDDNVKSATVGAVRGERTTGRAALSAEDRAKIENQGRELGMTSKEIAELLDRARSDMSRFPAKDGWAPIEIAGVERKPKTLSDGEVIYENAVKYKVIGYGFNAPPGAARAPARIDEKWARKVATRMTKEVTDLYARAAAGDVVAQNIVAHASWYRAMTVRLREEFGAAADFYADLLGATSPNTPVETNWRFAIDIIKQFSRGEWKREMQAFERWVASGKDVSKFSPNDKIRQMSGKLYGMNSGNAMLALANLWRNVQPGTAPKARNFALNLIGQSNMATIDVWAARLLRRMANSIVGSTGKYPRIPTVSEKGVTGNWSADVSRVTGEFGFGAHVMDLVSDDLAKKGIDLTPPDLQAVAWFVEKALWTEEGWTSAHGEGGSFETEADKARLTRFLAGWSIQKDSPPADAAVDLAARRLLAVTAGDDQVIAVRATPTVGMYDAESHERAFDTELTVSPGWNPWPFIGELTRIAKDADQDSFFVSRALGPDESVDNARPGMEVYFKTARDLESALTVIRELVSSGQQGFTLTVDPRDGRPAGAQAERFNGVRLQYIPEFEIRFGGPDAEALSSGDQSRVAAVMDAKREALSRIANQIYGLDGVAKVMTYEYDTLVVTREEYDDYSDAGLGVEFEGSRSPLRGGQPLRETLESAARRYASGRRQERSGDLPHGPSAWDRLAAEEEVGKPDALEVREGYDDADHWKKSDTLDARETNEPQPLWYSGLSAALDKAPWAKDGTAGAGQLRAWLAARTKDGLVKSEELKWSGLDEYLAAQPGKVSRDDIKAFLDQNGVRVEEVELGGRYINPSTGETAPRKDGEGATKFGSYQLPGGENYRELLLTLPRKATLGQTVYSVGYSESSTTPFNTREEAEAFNAQTYRGGARIFERAREGDASSYNDRNDFRSSHFDQPNILAHVRFNERTDAEGRRVLFLEELQADWAQAGRKHGFKPAPHELRAMASGSPEAVAALGRGDFGAMRAQAPMGIDGRPVDVTLTAPRDADDSRVPAGPFVQKTEAWVALALKRMIRYAADNGFDAVAFTTGEQQAARYDLSKQIESVEYRMRADGAMGHLTAFDKSGNRVLSQHNVKPADLPDYIGKEAADRLMQSQGPGIYQSNDKVYVLTGEQLKVGGEGMRSFYDKIVPNVANDLLKKLGGGRVAAVKFVDGIPGTVDRSGPFPSVNAAMQPGFSITPEMRENASKPQALFSAGLSLDAVTDGVRDRLATSRSFNLWDRTVGTQLHKALKNEHFKRVYDGVQSYLNDASQMMSRAADLAPDMLPRLDGFKDILKRGPSKADLAKVSSAIFDGTIADTVYTDAELAQRGLNAKQIGLYRQSRAAIDRSLADAVTSEAVKEARGLLPNAVLDQAKSASDPWVVVNALAAIAQKTPAQQQVYDHLRLRAAQMSDLQRDGYAPLQRFGQYTVHVTNQDGSSDLFTMHESEAEANAFARGVRATLRPGQSLTQGVMSKEAWRTFQGVSPDTLQIFAESLGSSESEVMQKYIKLAVNNRSVLKRMLQRKEIAGFQTDVQRTLAQFITSNARAASKNYHWGDILRAENDIPKESGDVKDEAIKMRSYVQDAREEAGALRGLLFVQFLGGSVASAVTNATQPIMMTFPWLSQHVGPAEAASQIAKAGKVAAGAAAEPGLREAMERATKEGVIAPHEVAGLYAESIRSLGSNLTVRRALKLWGSLFSLAEQFNRRITFVAAYRAAEQRALGDPYAFAERAIAESQGVYNKGNRPVWARGPVGATLMTFKQYSIAYVELLARLPKREKAIMLAVLVLASGLQGLPGADDLEDVIDTIAESLGYSFNSKRHLREWATRQLGDTFGPLLTHGASALPGVPLDVQARLGLGNLIPGTGVLKRSTPDKGRDVLEFFGPAGSQINSLKDAFAAAQDGDVGAIASAAAPLAIKNALKGLDMLQSGYYKDMKGRRVIDTEAYEAAIKGVGFQPARVAAQTRRIQDIQQDIDLARAVEGKIVERWARGMVEHDYAAVHAARAELLAWNQRNPGNPIRIMPAQVRNRAKMMLMGREDRFLKSVAPEMRGKIRAELAA